MTAYAELVAASNFSFLRGASRPEELADAASGLGYKGLAICDRNTVAGVVRAHKPAKQHGLHYIPGCRLVLQEGLEIACLPTDRTAWGRLCRLLTCGNRRAPKAECYLWLDDLIRRAEGQILLPPANAPGPDFAETAWDLASRFPGHVFIGAALAFDGLDARRLAHFAELGEETGAPMVAIGDCLYHVPTRKPLQDVVTCIREKCTIAEAGYRLQRNAERHLKHPQEIARLYTGYEDAVARTVDIASRCGFSLDELEYEYPDEPYEPFASPQEALVHHTAKGLQEKFLHGAPEKVRKQVEHELRLIEQLNYARYFLTVFDLVRYARSRDILCQGRGSAANSAVCYCLGVTGVNPSEIELLFERFISAERGEPPDIDIDFEHERREDVIQPRGYWASVELRDIPSGRIVKVAGIVLIRQRPGTASGVIFSTLEDETGIANIIIWPKIFERFRRIVLGARLLGQIQSEQGVIHIVARELFDMSGHLAKLAEKAPAAGDFPLARRRGEAFGRG